MMRAAPRIGERKRTAQAYSGIGGASDELVPCDKRHVAVGSGAQLRIGRSVGGAEVEAIGHGLQLPERRDS